MNADIKFRRYLEKIRYDPPVTPLPDNVLHLMRRTVELVELIYWEAKPTKGSKGEEIIAQAMARRRRNPGRGARSDPAKSVEMTSSEENGGEDVGNISSPQGMTKASWKLPWPDGADLETRMAYGRALMDGYGLWTTFRFHELCALILPLPRPRLRPRIIRGHFSSRWPWVVFLFRVTNSSLFVIYKTAPLYSDKPSVEAWRKGVGSPHASSPL
jgi:hypothetical protein